MVEYDMGEWVTKIREEIDGVQVDIFMNNKCCFIDEYIKETIGDYLKKGVKRGRIEINQPDKETAASLGWQVPFETVDVGDKVEFSTSGKYNSGYNSTDTYEGIVERINDKENYIIGTGCLKKAIIPLKHIEKIIWKQNYH